MRSHIDVHVDASFAGVVGCILDLGERGPGMLYDERDEWMRRTNEKDG